MFVEELAVWFCWSEPAPVLQLRVKGFDDFLQSGPSGLLLRFFSGQIPDLLLCHIANQLWRKHGRQALYQTALQS